jgi:hypothetical protein
VKRFRGGLIFKAHDLSFSSTLGSRAIKKKRRVAVLPRRVSEVHPRVVLGAVGPLYFSASSLSSSSLKFSDT